MKTVITAVVEGGLLRPLRPLQPLGMREGQEVLIDVHENEDEGPEGPTDPVALREALNALREGAKEHPEEFWDDFQAFIRGNKLNFPERT